MVFGFVTQLNESFNTVEISTHLEIFRNRRRSKGWKSGRAQCTRFVAVAVLLLPVGVAPGVWTNSPSASLSPPFSLSDSPRPGPGPIALAFFYNRLYLFVFFFHVFFAFLSSSPRLFRLFSRQHPHRISPASPMTLLLSTISRTEFMVRDWPCFLDFLIRGTGRNAPFSRFSRLGEEFPFPKFLLFFCLTWPIKRL